MLPFVAFANPQGGVVAGGNATITAPDTHTVNINQTTNKAIINWNSFNIRSNEATHFNQPSRNSITLNRVNPVNGVSSIYGTLTANGQVWIVNPAGIYFGPSAYVNVGGLLASTAGISDEDFMNGRYRFTQSPEWNGAVINDGRIISHHGVVALFAPGVQNNHLVLADYGTVVLASGTVYTLDFYGDGLISYTVTGKPMNDAIDKDGSKLQYNVSNTGKIVANSGEVLMTVSAAKHVIDNVVNTEGLTRINSARVKNGDIYLEANEGTVNVSGKLDASSKHENQSGGTIHVIGRTVSVDNAVLNASGAAGGGTILIGGDYHGDNSAIKNAQYTLIGSNATIRADATHAGDGGKIIVWSDIGTHFHGNISARGGDAGGNGGFVETSGKNYLDIDGGSVNASAPAGNAGTWLLDPFNVAIDNTTTTCTSPPCFSAGDPTIYTPDTNTSHVKVSDILAALEGGTSVTITTGNGGAQTGTIAVNAAIAKTSGTTPVTLTLDSSNGGGTINISNPISSTVGKLSVTLISGNAITVNGDITTNGGDFTSTSQNATTLSAGRTIDTGGGAVVINANADGAGGQDLTSNASSSITTSGGAVTINVNTALGGTGQASLGNIDTGGGTLTVATDTGGNTTGAAVVQAGTSTLLNIGTAAFSTGNGNITLTNDNDFTGSVDLQSGTAGRSLGVTDINALELGTITMPSGGGTLTVISNGAITQTSGKIITSGTGTSSFNSGTGAAITLTNNNVFNGSVALTTAGVNDAQLANAGNLALDNVSVGGNLVVQIGGGNITQSAAGKTIAVTGTSSFSATGGAITVANSSNAFTGAVSLVNTGDNDVSIKNTLPLTLSTTTIGRNLTVVTTGAGSTILQSGILTVAGTASFNAGANDITLTNASNSISGAVSLVNSGANNISFVNNAATILGTVTAGQNLNITSAGNLTQSGVITATGGPTTLSFTSANSDVALDTQANDFGSNTLSFGGTTSNVRDVAIENTDTSAAIPDVSGLSNLRNYTLNYTGAGVVLPALTLHNGGSLTVTAKGAGSGAIAQSGALIIPGTATFNSTAGTASLRSVILTDSGNQFGSSVIVNTTGSGAVNIVDSDQMLLGDITLGSGTVNFSGAGIAQTSGALFTGSGDITLAGNAGVIDLTSSGNTFTGNVGGSNTAVNDVTISNSGTLKLGSFTLTDGSDLSATGVGLTLTTGSALNTGSGAISLNSGTGTLTTSNNTQIFSTGTITLTGDKMTLTTAASSQIGGTALSTGNASNVILQPQTAGTTIGIAGGAGSLSLGAGELNRIFTNDLRIGNSSAGNITVAAGAVWKPNANVASQGVITLDTGAAISQGNGIDFTVNQAGLLLRDASAVTLTDSANKLFNIAGDLAGDVSITNQSGRSMQVSTLTDDLGTVSGLTANGAITLSTSGGGTLSVDGDVISLGNPINLNGSGVTQSDNTTINSGASTISVDGGGGVIDMNKGTLVSTNAGSAVTIKNASSVALGNITATSGTVNLGQGDITGAVTQHSGTQLLANALNVNTAGSVTLDQSGNTISTLTGVTRGGAFSLTDTGNLEISGSIAAGTVSNPVTIVTSGSLTLDPGVTIKATTSGDAVVLAAGSFINNAGASVLDTGSGRFLIWTTRPDWDNRGGLVYNFKQYNAVYGSTTVRGSGNGFLYSYAPKVTISLTGSVSGTFGNSIATLTPENYLISSGLFGDTVSYMNYPTEGLFGVGAGRNVNVTVTGLKNSNIIATDGSATVYGYQLTSTEASENIGILSIPSQLIMPYNQNYTPETAIFGNDTTALQSISNAALFQQFRKGNCNVFSQDVVVCDIPPPQSQVDIQ